MNLDPSDRDPSMRRAARAAPRTAAAVMLSAAAAAMAPIAAFPMEGASGPHGAPLGAASAQAAAEAAYRDGRDRDAFAAWSRMAGADPRDARAWLRVGNLWRRAGEPERAARAWRVALDGVPEESRARAALNLALLATSQVGDAVGSLDAQRLAPPLRTVSRLLERQATELRAVVEAAIDESGAAGGPPRVRADVDPARHAP